MKGYTDLGQSKTLTEILPIESADGYWFKGFPCQPHMVYTKGTPNSGKHIPCWSLSALLSVLPFHLIVDNQRYEFSMIKGLDKNGETYAIKYSVFNTTFYFHLTDYYNNPVDACVEMIFKLNELKLL